MAPLSLVGAGINVLTKSFGLFSSTSLARCACAISAAKPFSTNAGGPPKMPLTSYFRFMKDQRPQVLIQYPGIKNTDVSKKIAERWRVLPPNQKRSFQEAALAELNTYKIAKEQYLAKLTPEQSAALVAERRQKKAKRKAIRKRRELNTMGKPKNPRNSYSIFMLEHIKEARGVTPQAKLKSVSDDWNNLSASRKQVYMQLAEDDKVRYKSEMAMWEEHMTEIGREDLIRKKSRTTKKTPATNANKKAAKSKVTKSKTAARKKAAAGKKKTTKKVVKKDTRNTKKA